ncbi:MAG: hypothetical protein FWH11_01180 [Micrococcales bacterium]|nr:hypothetical protein [Micrococcales bacterium]
MTPQQTHPWRAAARTAAQVLVAVPAVLTTLALVGDLVARDDLLPAGWGAWLAAAAVTCSALAGLLARVMAVPAVDAWLDRALHLGSAPADPGGPGAVSRLSD